MALAPPLASPPAARRLAAALAVLFASSCAPAVKTASAPAHDTIPELYESPRMPGENIDSLAYWSGGEWIVATAKSTHRLLVLAAADGRLLRTVGEAGDGPGQFRRPNGVAVVEDYLLVVERDNRRIQVLRLPECTSVGMVGADVLRYPYGIAAFRSRKGIEVYVTDSYLAPDGAIPLADELDGRVRHFLLEDRGGVVTGRLLKSFGETSGSGILNTVESIAADPEHNRLLIADEAETARDIKVYDLEGRFTGVVIGHGAFSAEPEGLALVTHGQGGVWLAADQRKDRTRFLLFDRVSLRFLGSFTGTAVANTDGVAVVTGQLQGRPGGGIVAVNNDVSVAAFPLLEMHRVIRNNARCGAVRGLAPCRTPGRNLDS